MVCTNNFELAEKIKLYKEQGFVKNAKNIIRIVLLDTTIGCQI